MSKITHRHINYVLSVIVFLLGVFIIITPYIPRISFWWQNRQQYRPPAYVATVLEDKTASENTKPPTPERLIIPSIRLDEAILTGQSEQTVNKGVWLRPNTVPPSAKGNSVLVGHRFTNSPQVRDTFYNLDKLKQGDQIIVYWNNQPFTYQVSQIDTVAPTAVEVESQDRGDILTLYTCTPLWSSANRLVITATRMEQIQE